MGLPVNPSARPRYRAIVLRNGTPVSEVALSGDLTTTADLPIVGARVLVDPGDDMTAADALFTGVSCNFLVPGGPPCTFDLAEGCRALYLVGVGSGVLPADYAGSVGVISLAETDVAKIQPVAIRLDISSLEVARTVVLTMPPVWNGGLTGRVIVEAYSHV